MPIVKIGPGNTILVPVDEMERLDLKPGDLLRVDFERVDDVPWTDEPLGPDAQAALREAKADVAAGRVHGPFDRAEELIRFLRSQLSDAKA